MENKIVLESKMDALECLWAIEAIARLMQKAHEHTSDETTGIYGSALIIERNAQRLMAMIGEA